MYLPTIPAPISLTHFLHLIWSVLSLILYFSLNKKLETQQHSFLVFVLFHLFSNALMSKIIRIITLCPLTQLHNRIGLSPGASFAHNFQQFTSSSQLFLRLASFVGSPPSSPRLLISPFKNYSRNHLSTARL